MAAHTCNPALGGGAEAGRVEASLVYRVVLGWPGLHREALSQKTDRWVDGRTDRWTDGRMRVGRELRLQLDHTFLSSKHYNDTAE